MEGEGRGDNGADGYLISEGSGASGDKYWHRISNSGLEGGEILNRVKLTNLLPIQARAILRIANDHLADTHTLSLSAFMG